MECTVACLGKAAEEEDAFGIVVSCWLLGHVNSITHPLEIVGASLPDLSYAEGSAPATHDSELRR